MPQSNFQFGFGDPGIKMKRGTSRHIMLLSRKEEACNTRESKDFLVLDLKRKFSKGEVFGDTKLRRKTLPSKPL